MKFDTIIIGGGLSGLVAGIELCRKGQKCMIVSSGQSALHFFSGSFELHSGSEKPFDAIRCLPAEHPYSKIEHRKLIEYADKVKPLFKEIGITLKGNSERNHLRLTPLGVLKKAWLTMDEYADIAFDGNIPWKKVALLNVDGFLDFHPRYVAAGLAEHGVECVINTIRMPEWDKLRENPTEMRSTNIAKTISAGLIGQLAARINEYAKDVDAVLMPAVVGLNGCSDVVLLKEKVDRPLHFLATLPPSVPGIRLQMMLRKHFTKLGGMYMLGDSVTGGDFENGSLKTIYTVNHGSTGFHADNFILASGSFFSKGLSTSIDGVRETVFGLDVDCKTDRSEWYSRDMFSAQPYMSFGVRTDNTFRVYKEGSAINNLYAVGSILSGFNPLKEGSGAGVSILTSMHVSSIIMGV